MPTTITYDLTGSRPDALSMSFTQDGVTMDVSAGLFYQNSLAIYEYTPTLNMTGDGLGALNPYNDLEVGFDGDGKKEVAVFAFSQSVRIVEVGFTPLTNRYNEDATGTQFRVFRDGLDGDGSNMAIDYSDLANDLDLTGTLMGIGAQRIRDHFRITHITVEVDGQVEPPVLETEPDSYSLSSGDGATSLDVLANDNDVQSITGVNTTGLVGQVTIATDGRSVSYDSLGRFGTLAPGATATETFTYTVLGLDGNLATQTVTLTIEGADSSITGTAGRDNLTGTELADKIFGLADADRLYGRGGNDTIDGGAGADRIYGEDGNDSLIGGLDRDLIWGGEGNDTLVGDAGADRLYGDNGNDSLSGGDDADQLYGGYGNDTLVGGNGNDRIWSGVGVDLLIGGAGNDQYWVDDIGDVIVENANGGSDRVSAMSDYVLGENIEQLNLTDTAVIGTGNAMANRINGNDIANYLSGMDGADRIYGQKGDDTIDGGDGNDNLSGGDGNDTLLGGDGNDRLYGNAGVDQMSGGLGNDTFYVDNSGDTAIELANGGFDRVYSTASFNLGANIEALTLQGSANIDAYGNAGNNQLNGNDGANRLTSYGGNDRINGNGGNDFIVSGMGVDRVNGGAGNDTIIGGQGSDRLTGGTGADVFVFAEFGAAHDDTIYDFQLGNDRIGLDLAAFGLTPGSFQTNTFVLGTEATTESQRFIYDQARGDFWFDADGIGGVDAERVFSITDNTALRFGDLFAFV